ncbi:uncharacterized protein LOC106160971 [Lingula anatina]|uniref:Glycosyltransferase family 92 protein n=1 Tax=Lingula anatina TaxID=7574 RepID=A0A2R2MJ48_LINAN|nr:uncharacterized protein LOC106160971 [Lingula anatina]|eukprot:XP_023930102.1 uncharacterized protein LOC106160971 [Lingula anatina]
MTAQLPVAPKMLSSGLPDKEELTWKEQPGGKQYFFSAFYDDREGGHVRIVSLVDRETKPPKFCRVWYQEAGKTGLSGNLSTNGNVVRPAKLERNPKRGKYSASLYHCDVKGLPKPLAVSLMEDRHSAHVGNVPILKVIDKSRPSNWDANKLRRKIGVCVETALFEYSNFMRLIEFVEVYRTLGAEHFILYNYTGDPVMNPVIRAYVQQGIMTIIPWNLPPKLRVNSVGNEATEGVHYYAELSSIQDCLYRNMYDFKYVVFVDTDEFIVPSIQNDLYSLLESFPQDRAGYVGKSGTNLQSPFKILDFSFTNDV